MAYYSVSFCVYALCSPRSRWHCRNPMRASISIARLVIGLKFAVVQNGFDTDHYKFDANVQDRIRQSLKIANDAFVVGVVARVDPMKDYQTLLTALSTMRGFSL